MGAADRCIGSVVSDSALNKGSASNRCLKRLELICIARYMHTDSINFFPKQLLLEQDFGVSSVYVNSSMCGEPLLFSVIWPDSRIQGYFCLVSALRHASSVSVNFLFVIQNGRNFPITKVILC